MTDTVTQARTYRPYFVLQGGVTRYGAEHSSQGAAWREIVIILEGRHPLQPEWAGHGMIAEYGVEMPVHRRRRKLGSSMKELERR